MTVHENAHFLTREKAPAHPSSDYAALNSSNKSALGQGAINTEALSPSRFTWPLNLVQKGQQEIYTPVTHQQQLRPVMLRFTLK